MSQSHQKITDLQNLLTIIPKDAIDALVVFDVDMVLLEPTDPIFSGPCLKKYKHIYKKALTHKTPLEIDTYTNAVISAGNLSATAGATELLHILYDKNIATIALTASGTGILNGIDLLEARLKNFNVENLKLYDPEGPRDYIFQDIFSASDGHPMIKNHILFTNGQRTGPKKSVVLKRYLEIRKKLPDHVIFIDDRADNLDDVALFMAELYPNISFQSVEFIGAFLGTCDISEEDFEKTLAALSRNTPLS